MPKSCLECKERIMGREDKKFCGDGCRNAYNNKINKDSNNLMRNINNKLRKNYRILSGINSDGKIQVSRSRLLTKGFDFEFYTSTLPTENGNTYYFLYDQAYLPVKDDSFIIVKKEYLTPPK
ncbi:MAG: hypothetical protein JNM71_07460 [Flavobacterium lindanitolerans]|jgi:hypothetical protein|uniref:hypothetical protein n=1 Tax=Flavobacterium TaxID=237 RepID=UPI0006F9EB55|nr:MULTISPECIES: hypothetical protein [Flavobacterium]MBU7570645.1 hypothetical protein [Flavobacterium sp.]PZO34681.1 MAG: hypothetical protein DCE86_01205 [Flavobacteriaceae bacterium]PZQ87393.1 MAG: hypothetical protein DI548_05935 [Flavobacterium johnsoniae]KQS52836.1 hypothetical protein ASG38_17070 [Flavobacterium sp. Leaf359]MBL7867843.1 hypothetical protein [Flavobacterium lindanitolerans]